MTPRPAKARPRAAELPEVLARTREEWRHWLAAHHDRATGVWLVTYRKASGKGDLAYDAIVEEALCFGWIDSAGRAVDAERTALRLTPRKDGSGWSKANKVRIARLVAEGRMTPAGMAKVDAAHRDGSWSALDGVEALEVPEDLRRALAANAAARRHFDAFPPSTRKVLLTWITGAKRAETRAKRVAETVARAAKGSARP